MTMDYTDTMDPECIALCDAMNGFPGIRTIESCCGHQTRPYWVSFRAEWLSDLPRLLYYFALCHCGFADWRIEVTTDCGMSPVRFCVIGPIGDVAYLQADRIACLLREELQRNESA